MKRFIIDRFEENFAILEKEGGGTVNVAASLIPGGREGDAVILENGIYRVDEQLTKEREAIIAEKMRRLLGKK